MPEDNVFEVKLKFIENELNDIKSILSQMSKDERERLERYSDSNAKLCYLEREVNEIKETIENSPTKVRNWISIGITILLALFIIVEQVIKVVNVGG